MGKISPQVVALLAIAVGAAPFASARARTETADRKIDAQSAGERDRLSFDDTPTSGSPHEWRLFAQPTPYSNPPSGKGGP